ncbi:MAG: PSD1 and planctomycete cytochrome C domain-containing protein [Pirellulales bacterium]
MSRRRANCGFGRKGGLDVRLVRTMQSGGDSGASIVPGRPEESLLLKRVLSDEMPEGPKKLSVAEKDLLRRWIAQGAKTARPEPDDPSAVRFTEEETSHWAFRPITGSPANDASAVSVASDVSGKIDAMIARKLDEKGLRFSPEADRPTLIRRASFDLTGLPPTPAEVDAFVQDASPEAWEKVIDRLLSSPQYGVRWGRHWLDVAGYAETDGVVGKDRPRPYAWRYRDYVIQSLNQDKPYSEFIIEQLAGDELIEGEPDPENPRHVELLAATGFIRMAPDVTDADNSLIERNQAVAETLKVFGSAVLGLTVGCAQCHDHRYDPISIEDYYRLRAVFDPAMPLEHWRKPSERLIDMTDAAVKAETARIEAEAVAVQNDINERRRAHCKMIQDREINAAPEEVREMLRTALDTKEKDRNDEQKKLLDKYPKVRSVDWIIGQLIEYDMPTYRKFEEEEKKVAEIRKTKPLDRKIMALMESRDRVPKSTVFFRGDPASPKNEVAPGELAILSLNRSVSEIPALAPAGRTTGRRLAYARSLVDGSHPLTARVAVNRIWMHHFGRGIVKSAGDMGLNGDRPTHPELLDTLAAEFMSSGWQMKRLHKQLMMTRTYRQASQRTGEHDSDPENLWLARMPLRRLDAESIRDAMLSVIGDINSALDGPSVPVEEDGEGKAVIGKRALRDGIFNGMEAAGADEFRRSVFISVPRSQPLNMLETFDLPQMNPNCNQRMTSTVATQALWLLNDDQMVRYSDRLATVLESVSADDRAVQIREGYRRVFSIAPKPEEIERADKYLVGQTEIFRNDPYAAWQKELKEKPRAAEHRALASFCQVLLSSNRMLYVP